MGNTKSLRASDLIDKGCNYTRVLNAFFDYADVLHLEIYELVALSVIEREQWSGGSAPAYSVIAQKGCMSPRQARYAVDSLSHPLTDTGEPSGKIIRPVYIRLKRRPGLSHAFYDLTPLYRICLHLEQQAKHQKAAGLPLPEEKPAPKAKRPRRVLDERLWQVFEQELGAPITHTETSNWRRYIYDIQCASLPDGSSVTPELAQEIIREAQKHVPTVTPYLVADRLRTLFVNVRQRQERLRRLESQASETASPDAPEQPILSSEPPVEQDTLLALLSPIMELYGATKRENVLARVRAAQQNAGWDESNLSDAIAQAQQKTGYKARPDSRMGFFITELERLGRMAAYERAERERAEQELDAQIARRRELEEQWEQESAAPVEQITSAPTSSMEEQESAALVEQIATPAPLSTEGAYLLDLAEDQGWPGTNQEEWERLAREAPYNQLRGLIAELEEVKEPLPDDAPRFMHLAKALGWPNLALRAGGVFFGTYNRKRWYEFQAKSIPGEQMKALRELEHRQRERQSTAHGQNGATPEKGLIGLL